MARKLAKKAKLARTYRVELAHAGQLASGNDINAGHISPAEQQAHTIKRLEEGMNHLYQIVNRANLNGPKPPSPMDCEPVCKIQSSLAVASTPHQGEIGKVYQELQPNQEVTQDLIDELVQKLDQILVPQPPATPVAGSNVASPTLFSGVANGLQMRVDTQRSINARLRDLLSRIAL